MKHVALDFETSGLDARRHAPISLGVALMDGHEVLDQAEWVIAPPLDKNGNVSREYDVTALEKSGATWPEIKKGRLLPAVCAELMGFARRNEACRLPVVAFHAPFDLAFYSEMLFLAGSWNTLERRFEPATPPLVGPWQCARLLAIEQLGIGALPKFDLDSVARHFGLQRESNYHTALGDAILAGQVYAHLLSAQAKQEAA